MIYQINGKAVNHKPLGYFLKVVTVPGKLMNFITKDRKKNVQSTTASWMEDGLFHHVVEVIDGKKISRYENGILISVN